MSNAEVDSVFKEARQSPHHPRKIWLAFMNYGLLAHRLQGAHGCSVTNFGLDNDWDLTDKD